MVEATKKETKPKAVKAPVAKKEAPAAKKEAPKQAAAKKPVATGAQVKVTQMVGTIARRWDQEATLKGLGLGKRHRSRVLQDTPEVRGMIYKVRHLVKVENVG